MQFGINTLTRREWLVLAGAAAGSSLLFVSHDTSLATRFDRALSLAELNRASQPETF